MNPPESTYLFWAVMLGALSAISLPLGSAVGLVLRPRASIAALLTAFGAGALIAALTLELVAPTLQGAQGGGEHGTGSAWDFGVLALGALAGGTLFVVLDRVLAARGGFLRKASTIITHFSRRERIRQERLLKDISRVGILRMLPAEQVGLMVRDVRTEDFGDGARLFAEGDVGESLYFIRSGEVELHRGGRLVRTVGAGASLGEIALVAQVPRTLAATARGPVGTLVLRRADVDRWRAICPEFDVALRELAQEHLDDDRERGDGHERWARRAKRALAHDPEVPTPAEIRQLAAEHEGAPLAVWLGMLIDGIPESIVIGSGLLALVSAKLAVNGDVTFGEVVPYALIAGLFLSNFPEALSSSLGMKIQGWSTARVLSMWTGLMLITALGAGVGCLLGESVSHQGLIAVEGFAAGAMLTMIASTMIPEAVHLAGSGAGVGLGTLLGFLSASAFKLLE